MNDAISNDAISVDFSPDGQGMFVAGHRTGEIYRFALSAGQWLPSGTIQTGVNLGDLLVVPEPTSLTLLGLGALALRRRKTRRERADPPPPPDPHRQAMGIGWTRPPGDVQGVAVYDILTLVQTVLVGARRIDGGKNMGEREAKLEQLGYPIADAPTPAAIYRLVSVDGTTAYCSGAVPLSGGKLAYRGKVPSEVPLETAQKAAALCAANCLRMVGRELGSLDRIERVLRVTGYVNTDPDFTEQHLVINGASQLLLDVFGEDKGLAARSAVGMAQLPLGSAVEVEMILKLTS